MEAQIFDLAFFLGQGKEGYEIDGSSTELWALTILDASISISLRKRAPVVRAIQQRWAFFLATFDVRHRRNMGEDEIPIRFFVSLESSITSKFFF